MAEEKTKVALDGKVGDNFVDGKKGEDIEDKKDKENKGKKDDKTEKSSFDWKKPVGYLSGFGGMIGSVVFVGLAIGFSQPLFLIGTGFGVCVTIVGFILNDRSNFDQHKERLFVAQRNHKNGKELPGTKENIVQSNDEKNKNPPDLSGLFGNNPEKKDDDNELINDDDKTDLLNNVPLNIMGAPMGEQQSATEQKLPSQDKSMTSPQPSVQATNPQAMSMPMYYNMPYQSVINSTPQMALPPSVPIAQQPAPASN